MNKNEFIVELCMKLRSVPADEAQRTVLFYSEAIDDRMEDGMSEADAVAAVGSIDDIVRELTGNADNAAEDGSPVFRSDASASGGDDGSDDVKTNDYTYDTKGISAINVTDTSSDVTVLPSDDEFIHVVCTEGNGIRYEIIGGTALTVRKVVEQKKHTVNVFGVSFNLPTASFFGFGGGEDDLTIRIPAGYEPSVTVNTASGDIKVHMPQLKSLNARSASGDVDVAELQCAENVNIKSVSGDMEIYELSCPGLTVSSVSGDIMAKGICSDRVKLSVVSGDVRIKESCVVENISVNSVSGDISCTLSEFGGKADFESLSGDVEASLPGASEDYVISTKTGSGRMHAPQGSAQAEKSIRAKTSSGNIDLDFRA